MDTSKEYIKMCDCEEVQRHRNSTDNCKWFKMGDWRVKYHRDKEIILVFGDRLESWRKLPTTWLPRQDQIQEMMGMVSPESWYRSNTGWPAWDENFHGYADVFVDTGEKLWLCFFMQEKHGKKWDGEGWK